MARSKKRHDIWKGSLIETFDTRPLKPTKPTRVAGPGYNARKPIQLKPIELTEEEKLKKAERDAQRRERREKQKALRETKAARLKHEYLSKYGEKSLRSLEEKLSTNRNGSFVSHSKFGIGQVQKCKKGHILVLFPPGKKISFHYPECFYDRTLLMVEKPKLDDYPTIKKTPSSKSLTGMRPPQRDGGIDVGTEVDHEVYGVGSVIRVDPTKVSVHFRLGLHVKAFPYPSSIEKGILTIVERDKNGRMITHRDRPKKPPRLHVKDGKLVCPSCGFTAQPGSNMLRCPQCKLR